MTEEPIVMTKASGQEVADIVRKIVSTLEGENKGHAIMALISLLLILQKPSLGAEDIQEGIKDVSQFVCMWLDSKGQGTKPRILAN